MNVVEQQTIERVKNLVNSIRPTPDDEPKSCQGFLGLSRRDTEKYSVFKAITGKLASIRNQAVAVGSHGGWTGLEAECDAGLQAQLGPHVHGGRVSVPLDILYRDLGVSVASAGGYLVGTSNGSFIDVLRNTSVLFRLGAQRVSGLRENLAIPRQTAGSTLTWFTVENTQAAETTGTYAQVSGTPKTGGVYTEISDKLLKLSDAEPIVMRGLASDLAVGVDAAALTGTGGSGQPLGILNTLGIGTFSGTSLAYAALVEAQTDVADNNAVLDPSALGYVTTPGVAQTLKGRQRFTGTDSPLWRGAIHRGEIEGVQALSTKQMPASTVLYGDFSSLVIAEWGVLSLELDPFTSFQKGIVGIRALWSMDCLVKSPLSFSVATSVT